MDSSGRMYMPPEYEKQLVEMFEGKTAAIADEIRFGAVPEDAMPIEDEAVALGLAGMNRRARLVFFSERGRGATESAALAAAKDSLPR